MFSHAIPFLHHNPIMMADSGNLSSPFSSSSLSPPLFLGKFELRSLLDIQILEITFALFVFFVIHVVRQKRRYGLPVWPVVGMLPALITAARGNLYEWITDLLRRHKGTFMFRGPWFSSLNCVVTADPRNLEHLLKTKFASYPKGPFFRDTVRDLLGDGIFGADDETWQRQRKVASIEFHSARFRQMTVELMAELVHSRLEGVLKDFAGRSATVDLQDVLLRLTFDNVCMIAFGVDPGCLRDGLPEIPFAKAFEDATEVTVLRFITPELGNGEEAEAIDKSRRRICRERDSNTEERTLYRGATASREPKNRPINRIHEAERRARAAILRQVPQRYLCQFHTRRKRYILCGIELVLLVARSKSCHRRKNSSRNLQNRRRTRRGQNRRDSNRFVGVQTRGNQENGVFARRDFRIPERWMRDGRFMSESAYRFAAFNGGPRLCLGKDFAYYQMKYVAASIIGRYRVAVAAGHPVEPKLALTFYMKYGLKVNLIKREEGQIWKYMKLN